MCLQTTNDNQHKAPIPEKSERNNMGPTAAPALCLEENLSGGTGRDNLSRTCLDLNIEGKMINLLEENIQ